MIKKGKAFFLGVIAAGLLISVAITGCDFKILSDNSSRLNQSQQNVQVTNEYIDSESFDDFAYEIFVFLASDNALDLNRYIKDPISYGIEETSSYWPSYSPERIEEKYDQMQEYLDHLLQYDEKELSSGQRITYDYILFYLQGELSIRAYYLLHDPLSYYSGVHHSIEYSLNTFILRDHDDINNYFDMIIHIDDFIQGLIDYQKARSESGYFMSADHAQRVIDSCQYYIDYLEEEFMFGFERRVDDLDWLSAQEKEQYKSQNRLLVKEHIQPAFRKIIRAMENLADTGMNGRGLSRFEGGAEYYTRRLQSKTGTNRSVDEIFQILEMNLVQWEEKYRYLDSRVDFESFDTVYFPYTTPEIIISNNLMEMQGRFPIIENKPEEYYLLQDVPESLEGGVAGIYSYAPLDDPWFNIIYISRRYFSSGFDLYEVVSHEAIPGHLYQTVYFITSEANNMELRYWLSAINESLATLEGWTTYVEGVSHGMAGLGPDEIEYAFLHGGISMISLSIIDIGMHYYGWSRQDVVNYFRGRTALEFITIDNMMFDQIESTPLQHIPYVLGYIDLTEMLNEAKETLGEDFNEYDFHTFYLDMGMSTMDTIKREFENWLFEQDKMLQDAA